jgi:thioredoxin 1
MDPLLDELAGEHGERLRFVKVNVDENQDVAARYDILSIPTLLVFEGGEVRRKLIGAVARRRLEEELAAWLGATA